jgi:hypothetical protein
MLGLPNMRARHCGLQDSILLYERVNLLRKLRRKRVPDLFLAIDKEEVLVMKWAKREILLAMLSAHHLMHMVNDSLNARQCP